MSRLTRNSLKDSDITLERVQRQLERIAKLIKKNNNNNLTDVNIICEEIFGRILNKIFGINLKCCNPFNKAVDLVDYNSRIAYQVTSNHRVCKIKNTINIFKKSDMVNEIDSLNFLILGDIKPTYKKKQVILNNGKIFSYEKNIISFNELIDLIEKKENQEKGFLVEIYNDINMVFDSGRLEYFSVVDKTEKLTETIYDKDGDFLLWKKGVGDFGIVAYIPLSYKEQMGCFLQWRQNGMAAVHITLDEDQLIENYFLSEEAFEKRHNSFRYKDEEYMWIKLENCRVKISAYTAYHVYILFKELEKVYYKEKERIEEVLGVKKYRRVDDRYFLMTIEKKQWEEMLCFSRHHNWLDENGDREWNIFNDFFSEKQIYLSPYKGKNGDILAKIVAEISIGENRVDLFWKPGYRIGMHCMEGFDNIVKWKADYTKAWIEEKFIPKAHNYFVESYGRKSFWGKMRMTWLKEA